MAGTHTLSGDILTLIGGDDFERLRAYVSMDQPRLVDPDDTTQNRVGDIDVILPTDTSTAIAVELPDETWLPAPHWFRLHVEYRSRTAGVNKVWVSNEFEMTADRTIGSIPTDMPRAISEADYESLLTARDEAVAAAASVTLPTDGIIAGRINDPTSATASALTAATEAIVANFTRIVEHLDDPDFARPDTTNRLIWVGSVRPLNMDLGDIWFVSTEQAVEPPIAWTVDLDASTLALTDGSPVTTWLDNSGNGHHATQTDATKKPIFHIAAGGAPAFVRADGANDSLQTAAMTALTQPFTMVVAFRLATVTVSSSVVKAIVYSIAASPNLIGLQQRGDGTAARLQVYGGSAVSASGINPVAGQWYIASIVYNGGTSSLRVNGTSYTLASSPGTGTPTGLTLFASNLGASFADADLAAVKIIGGTIPNLRDVEQALADRVGVVLAG